MELLRPQKIAAGVADVSEQEFTKLGSHKGFPLIAMTKEPIALVTLPPMA